MVQIWPAENQTHLQVIKFDSGNIFTFLSDERIVSYEPLERKLLARFSMAPNIPVIFSTKENSLIYNNVIIKIRKLTWKHHY